MLALKKIQKIAKDINAMVQAQNEQKPLTQEQIVKNTSMAQKPPSALANTSGRPPVAPPTPEPAPSNLQAEPLNVIAPGKDGNDPWASQTPAAKHPFARFAALNSRLVKELPPPVPITPPPGSKSTNHIFIDAAGNVDLARLNNELTAGRITQEQYNRRRAELEAKYRRK